MKKAISAVLAMVIIAGMFTVSADAAGVFDDAKTMNALQKYTANVNYGREKCYKITLTKDGTITLRGKNHYIDVRLFNPNAEVVWTQSYSSGEYTISNLKAGTYYLEIKKSTATGSDDSTFTDFYYTFTPDDKPTLAIKISVKAKTEIQLGSIVTDYKGKVTWTSSSKSVATVNDKGLVKTLKKGTAVIRAELDDGTFDTIKITVT